MINNRKKPLLLIASVLLGVLIGLVIASNFGWTVDGLAVDKEPANNSVANQPVPLAETNAKKFENQFVEIAKRVKPTVVTITSQKVIKVRQPWADFFNDDPFFRRFFQVPGDGEQEYMERGLGSGVIVDPKGHILTNYHVIQDSDEINVIIDKVEHSAEIVGTDPATDLAVIRVDKRDLPAAILGDSDKLEVGEWVLAVGSPFDIRLEHTVTAGIVSAKGRSGLGLGGDLNYQNFIQTDAAINPGNSGGALVNLRGELVGINTAIISSGQGGHAGIGFAIPINLAKNVMDQLIEHGKVVRGWLGVGIQSVNAEVAESLGMKEIVGALVSQVMKESPAEKAGLQEYDVIKEVDGKRIEDAQELTNLIASYQPSTEINIEILRDGKMKSMSVKLDEWPESNSETPRTSQPDVLGRLSLKVSDLTKSLQRRFRYEGEEGVFITHVQSGSQADEINLQPGDLIIEVNRKRVKSVHDLDKILTNVQAEDIVLFYVKRGERSLFKAMTIPKS